MSDNHYEEQFKFLREKKDHEQCKKIVDFILCSSKF